MAADPGVRSFGRPEPTPEPEPEKKEDGDQPAVMLPIVYLPVVPYVPQAALDDLAAQMRDVVAAALKAGLASVPQASLDEVGRQLKAVVCTAVSDGFAEAVTDTCDAGDKDVPGAEPAAPGT